MAGRVSAEAAAGLAGRPTLEATTWACTAGVSRYFRKSAQAGSAAPVVQEKPSPPPSAVVADPAPPGTEGNGNQPSCELRFLSVVRGVIVPGSQSPCSSIAALPFATMPTELPEPSWAAVPRKPVWNGFVAINDLRSLPAVTKHGALRLSALIAAFSVAVEHSRTAKYSHQNASGHLSLLPTAMGAMCAAFSFATSALSSVMVVGGLAMPALVNRSLRYQKPTVCRSYGTPYCLPFTCQALAATPSWLIQLEVYGVRSVSLPDGTWVASWPEPHCW